MTEGSGPRKGLQSDQVRVSQSGVGHDRAGFGLPPEAFLFLLAFDYSSVAERKNPLGLVKAFRAAFPEEPDVGLVLKATGAPDLGLETRAALAESARQDLRIVILDRTMPRDDVLSLIRTCDAFVSLHRSEGFGFGLAEAMALGRPVIATDYSGSTDILSERTGWPVPFTLRPVGEGEYPHGDGQLWAEPDLDAAAETMRRVRSDRAERERRAEAGRRFVGERFGTEEVGRIASERLREVLRKRRPP